MRTYLFAVVAAMGIAGLAQPHFCRAAEPSAKKVPVILDTDIGDDIDDTWALALLLKSPEVDVKLVVSDSGNTTYRAKILAKMLEVAKRTDIPVGVGVSQNTKEGGQAAWVKDYDLARYPGKVHQDGVGAMIDTIMNSPEPLTLICIGPVPNIKVALERKPEIATRARFVGMHGSVRLGYDGKSQPNAEWNVVCDAKAAQKAFTAAWPMRITPLDTCGLVRLRGEKYRKVAESKDPVAQAVIENYRLWRKASDPKASDKTDASSVLFDTVAIYLAYSTDLAKMETLPIRVTDDGFTRIDPQGKSIECAMAWKDLGAFEDFLVARITAPAVAANTSKPADAALSQPGGKGLFDGKSLKGWKSTPFGGEGKVVVKDGEIVMERGEMMTGITYTAGDFPKMDYEVSLEGKKIDGHDFFCTTTFPVNDSFCSFVVGGWGGTVVGISSVDFSDASENSTTKSVSFKSNQWYKVRIRVSKDRVEAWIDDERLVDLSTKGRKLSTRFECDPCKPFGIATYSTTGAVRDIRVRLLTEAEKKAAAERTTEDE